ncbi:hypothetical protein [Polaribacter sp.]|uniref:hypothetical protein n=1 Tax=Polaribacter sp. TaxID=1920175 RepID=UPI0025E05721|nr:hypothetical protein [Polaribacter sp.]
MKQSEYINAIARARNRMDNKNTFFVKQLQDEILELKRKEKFWVKKYFNLKKQESYLG